MAIRCVEYFRSKATRSLWGPALPWSAVVTLWSLMIFITSLAVQLREGSLTRDFRGGRGHPLYSPSASKTDISTIPFDFGSGAGHSANKVIEVVLCPTLASGGEYVLPSVELYRVSPWSKLIAQEKSWSPSLTTDYVSGSCRYFPPRLPTTPRRSGCKDDAVYYTPDLPGRYEIRVNWNEWSHGRRDNLPTLLSVHWRAEEAGRIEDPPLAYDSSWIIGGPSSVNCNTAAIVLMSFVAIPVLLFLHGVGLGTWFLRRRPFASQVSKDRMASALVHVCGVNVVLSSILWWYVLSDALLFLVPCLSIYQFVIVSLLYIRARKEQLESSPIALQQVRVEAARLPRDASTITATSIAIKSSSSSGSSSSSSSSAGSSARSSSPSSSAPNSASSSGTPSAVTDVSTGSSASDYQPSSGTGMLYVVPGSHRPLILSLQSMFLAVFISAMLLKYIFEWYDGPSPRGYSVIMPWPIVFMGLSMLCYWTCVALSKSLSTTEYRPHSAIGL